MYFLKISFVILLLFSTLSDDQKKESSFISPVKIPLTLSANFGELRFNHFHSGLDIKTQGVTGKEVVATASGYVYRISVSPGGFGKALYIHHSNGYSTVYAHLDRFAPEIEEYVESRQYAEKSFMVTLWPQRDRFRFKKGELIGYSGNSGSSAGPHLHYEIRKSDNEIPVNPLSFDLGIKDNIPPVIEILAIYPLSKNTLINKQRYPLKINVSGENGRYSVYSKSGITISGAAGFGFKSFDLLNGSSNRCSAYSAELKIDGKTVYSHRMDAISFSESRYINSHIDYKAYLKDNKSIEHAFVLPNDKLGVYHNLVNRGIYMFNDSRDHHVELILTDIRNNRSVLAFNVKSVPLPKAQAGTGRHNTAVVMPYNRNNKYVSKNISVYIPSGTLYDTLNFEFKRSEAKPGMYSDIYQVHNMYTPVHKPYTLSVRPSRIQAGRESKMIIVQLDDNMKRTYVGGKWEDGYLTAHPTSLGTFFIGIDTVPPGIATNGLISGANLSGKSEIRIRITDDFSGIKSYDPSIDGNWALFEYDQKNNTLIYRFDSERITRGITHRLFLTVTDNCDNINTYSCNFRW